MKETVYRCNRCHKLINGTVNRIGATDEKGEQTKYGALFDNMDLCDSCMEKVTLSTISEIERNPGQQEQNSEPEGQQDCRLKHRKSRTQSRSPTSAAR